MSPGQVCIPLVLAVLGPTSPAYTLEVHSSLRLTELPHWLVLVSKDIFLTGLCVGSNELEVYAVLSPRPGALQAQGARIPFPLMGTRQGWDLARYQEDVRHQH